MSLPPAVTAAAARPPTTRRWRRRSSIRTSTPPWRRIMRWPGWCPTKTCICGSRLCGRPRPATRRVRPRCLRGCDVSWRSTATSAAEADGFRNYIPAGAAPILHFTKIRWAFQARNGLDPARPTSLLYQRAADGSLTLAGAMFTAPPQTSDAELDARLPLSIARWHQHINWCLPPLADARRRWAETKNGQPVFGPKSPIATAEAGEAVGGRFRPRLFGWMVHVMAFSDGDPWNAHHH